MPSPDRDYITAHPYAVIVRYASGNNVLYKSFHERALAEKLAAGLVAQGKRAFVRVDLRLPELLEERGRSHVATADAESPNCVEHSE